MSCLCPLLTLSTVLLTGLQRFVLYPPSAGSGVPTYPYVHPYVTHASADLHELSGVAGGMEAVVGPGDLLCKGVAIVSCCVRIVTVLLQNRYSALLAL